MNWIELNWMELEDDIRWFKLWCNSTYYENSVAKQRAILAQCAFTYCMYNHSSLHLFVICNFEFAIYMM